MNKQTVIDSLVRALKNCRTEMMQLHQNLYPECKTECPAFAYDKEAGSALKLAESVGKECIAASELKLGDRVRLNEASYADATVKQIDENVVHLIRPYIHHEDFSYTGGVICYIGTEDVVISRSDARTVVFLEKGNVNR